MITEENPEKHWHLNVAAPANLLDWRDRCRRFRTSPTYGLRRLTRHATLTGPRRRRACSQASYVTGNFFSMLGVAPALGRTFADEETWQSRAAPRCSATARGADASAATRRSSGKTIALDGREAPGRRRDAAGLRVSVRERRRLAPDRWDPRERGAVAFRRAHWVRAVARAQAGRDRSRMPTRSCRAVVERLKREYPATNKYMGATDVPLHRFLVGDTRLPLLVLLDVGRISAAHRVRERRQSAARASRRHASAKPRCVSRSARDGPARSPSARRESRALARSAARAGCARLGGHARARATAAAGDAARQRLRRRWHGARCTSRDHRASAAAVRRRAGAVDASTAIRRMSLKDGGRGGGAGRAVRGAGATRWSSAKSRSRC